MSQEELLERTPFFAHLKTHYEAQEQSPSSLNAFRREAWKKFLKLGIPHRKHEAFRYLPLSQFYLEEFQPSAQAKPSSHSLAFLNECKKHGPSIVFINGQYSSALSTLPAQVRIQSLKEAFSTHGNFLQHRLSTLLKDEQDPFACLNLSYDENALFVYVPPKLQLDAPIQCIHLISSETAIFALPRIHLFLGKESHIQWIDQFHTQQDTSYGSFGLFDIALEENAYLHHTSLIQGNDQGWNFDALRVSLKSSSELQSVCFMDGAKSARQDIHVRLNAEHAKAELKGINLLKNHRGAHQRVLMDHQSPHCRSMQLFKAVLDDASQSSFEGKIYVAKGAQKTEAYQLNHNLILKDHAQANCKPNLEIYADDVKASHGATVSQLCEQQMLYLKTRGLSPEGAKTLLITAFCREIIDQIPHPFLQKRLQEVLHRVIS